MGKCLFNIAYCIQFGIEFVQQFNSSEIINSGWSVIVNKNSAKNRWGVTAGVICFVILYAPLADVLIRYYRWRGSEPIRDLIIGLLIAVIAPILVSAFLGYSVSKRDSRLILIACLIVAVALVAVSCIYSLSLHPFN
jgi:RsiW-degrading membrane proteinase PrsW (M82 family)